MKDVIANCINSLNDFRKWDENIFMIVCKTAANSSKAVLEALDDELAKMRDKELKIVGRRTKTIVTKFGSISLKDVYTKIKMVNTDIFWTKHLD